MYAPKSTLARTRESARARIYLSTNGCEEGRLSTKRVQNFFTVNSLSIVKNPADADIIIFYACGLTKEKENDSITIIKNLKSRMKTSAKIIVWGCLPMINPKSLKNIYEGPKISPKDFQFFEKMIEYKINKIDKVRTNSLVPRKILFRLSSLKSSIIYLIVCAREKFEKITHASPYYIRVARGCTGNCTFCSEKIAWGRIESIKMERILGEFKRGLHLGFRKFFLIASDFGAYGIDIGCTLIELLNKIISEYKDINYKLILMQINPSHMKQLYSELEKVFESGKIGKLGCQVQSGSNKILKLMGRQYTAEDWVDLMTDINRKFPNIQLSTHLMVGFPTESDSDFKATCNLLYKVQLDEVCIFKYSNRPTLPARKLTQQVPEKIKEIRYKQLSKIAFIRIIRTKIRKFESL